MTVAFVSCYLSIHQVPFCEEMYAILGNGFHYIADSKISEWRLETGYSDIDSMYPFVIKAYENEAVALSIAFECDVLIVGSAPDKYIEKRLRNNKLTFRCSERFFKNPLTIRKLLRAYISSWKHHGRFRKKPLYMLCASAYTANDSLRFYNYKNKMFKWGYFPETLTYDVEALFDKKNSETIELLWVGRLIEWKHPLMAIETARYLHNTSLKYHLSIIGSGEQEEIINKSIKEYGLESEVDVIGAIPADQVRRYMEAANIFIFTSDQKEGWGAVVNEAMNSGCAVVACNASGSVPFLIKNEENGITFCTGDQKKLNTHVERLINDKQFRERLGRNAYITIHDTWNAHVATQRLLKLISILPNGNVPFRDGPCSVADKII